MEKIEFDAGYYRGVIPWFSGVRLSSSSAHDKLDLEQANHSSLLTKREKEVMEWTAHGKTRGEIALILSISEDTVKYYIKNVCAKLDAVNKTHATAKAILLGHIAPDIREINPDN